MRFVCFTTFYFMTVMSLRPVDKSQNGLDEHSVLFSCNVQLLNAVIYIRKVTRNSHKVSLSYFAQSHMHQLITRRAVTNETMEIV
jgi:hypothetical protein